MTHVGIDLGTTNSLAAYLAPDGTPTLIPNAFNEFLTPSAVSILEDGTVTVGKHARERLLTHPERTAAAFKRFMGTQKRIELAGNTYSPEELSALVLKSLLADIQSHLNEPITQLVISVPAYFNDLQRKATINAARIAGLKDPVLINEPTAAALFFGVSSQKEGTYLILDLGGGTFDVSLIEKIDTVIEVRASTGDSHLGGEDFTDALSTIILEKIEPRIKTLTPKDAAKLYKTAEFLKCGIDSQSMQSYSIQLSESTVAGVLFSDDYTNAIKPLLSRIKQPILRALGDANQHAHSLTDVLLVGGATRLKAVQDTVRALLGREGKMTLNPDHAIALGAAIQAGLIDSQSSLKEYILTDVCPFTLGVGVRDEFDKSKSRVDPIIERNAILPISRSSAYFPASTTQTILELPIYQGEYQRPEDNLLLGTLTRTIPVGKNRMIEVRFTYDTNGTLEVVTHIPAKNETTTEYFNNSGTLSNTELQERFTKISHVKLPPREHVRNKYLLALADRVYANASGDDRGIIAEARTRFERSIEKQDVRDFSAMQNTFEQFLDQFERRDLFS